MSLSLKVFPNFPSSPRSLRRLQNNKSRTQYPRIYIQSSHVISWTLWKCRARRANLGTKFTTIAFTHERTCCHIEFIVSTAVVWCASCNFRIVILRFPSCWLPFVIYGIPSKLICSEQNNELSLRQLSSKLCKRVTCAIDINYLI